MRCDEALSIIDMYLDECTDAYDEKEFLEHIETCESCRNAYNEIKRITNELNNIDYLPLPDNFHNELTEKLVKSGKSKKRSTLVKYSAIAACAVVIFITGAYMKDLYYMASNGNSAASADTASVTESSQMSRSASEAMPQESPEFSSDSSSASIYDSAEGGVTNEAAQSDLSGAKLSADEENLARKIVKNGYISLDVENFDDTAKLIKNYTEQNNGYVEQSSQYANYDSQTNSYIGKSGNITLKIESDKFYDTMDYIETLGTVTDKSESVEDITSSYVDIQSRLEVKEQEKERLTELLNNADNISDIISIEERLTNVISDIESFKAQLNSYNDVVDYSSININITESDNNSIIPAKTDFTNKAVYNFKTSAKTLLSGFENILLFVIRAWAPLVFVAVVFGAAVIFIRTRRNKK